MAHPEPTGEAEEHHGSPWPVIIAIGMGVGYVGIVSVSIPMLLVGLAIFGGGLGGWIHQDLQRPSSAFYGAISAIESKFPRVSARKLGMWLFLATEIMLFSAVIGTSWTLRLRTTVLGTPEYGGEWVIPGVTPPILNVPLTGLNTFILICSSLTMVEALGAIERGNQKRLRLFRAATLLLGITFLSIQAFEYQHLYFGEHLTFKSAPFNVNPLYAPTFYAQTRLETITSLVVLAAIKASLVVAYYMHLRYEPRWIALIPLGGLALVAVLVAALTSTSAHP